MLLLAAALSAACDENAVQQIAGPPAGGASIKFFNFAPGAPAVNFFVNDTKITAISSTTCATLTDANRAQCTTTGAASTNGVAYGAAGNGASGWYSDVAPGQVTISGRIAATTDQGLAIASVQATIAAGKTYSYYMSGIYNTAAKTADAFVVEDNLPAVDHNVAYVRFVNAVSNATGPMTLFATATTTSTETAVGGSTAYKSAGAFTALPAGTYNLGTRYAGSSANAISRTNVGFSAGRVYTITARGNITTASTILLDNTANR